MVRIEKRRGQRRLVIDIVFRNPDGSQARYRHDAEVQTLPAARAEDQRRLGLLALTGSPYGNTPKAPTSAAVPEAQRIERKTPPEATTPASDVPLFRDITKEYLAAYATSNLKPSTRIGYESKLNYLLNEIGHLPITEITPAKVRELDAQLVETGVTPSTRRGHQIVLRSILGRFAVERGYLSDPPRFPKLPRCGKQIHTALTSDEVERLLKATHIPEHRRAFLLAAYAGLRAGEIRALRWKDVDLKARTLIVRVNLCHGVLSAPKSGNERLIPLPAILYEDLSRTPKPQREPDARVATTGYDKPWGQHGLLQAFRRATKRAGLDGWRFHDLRHYFVTSLFQAGAPANAVQALAGHASLATTQRYAHTTRADLRAAIDRLVVATPWQQSPETSRKVG
jgi:integrase